MPAYHSSFNKGEFREACACLILPLKTNIRGPAPPAPGDTLDIADEILDFFRANVLFSNFEIQGGADRVLVYGTLYVHACLKKMENLNHEQAKRTLQTYAVDTFSLPGDSGFPLGGMTPAPKNSDERETIRGFMKQLREVLASRLIERVYASGEQSKWWMFFAKRKFMNKELK